MQTHLHLGVARSNDHERHNWTNYRGHFYTLALKIRDYLNTLAIVFRISDYSNTLMLKCCRNTDALALMRKPRSQSCA